MGAIRGLGFSRSFYNGNDRGLGFSRIFHNGSYRGLGFSRSFHGEAGGACSRIFYDFGGLYSAVLKLRMRFAGTGSTRKLK